jgi:hypothetical protein
MKRLVSLLLCLSLTIFTAARAMKPSHMLAAIAKAAQKEPTGQKVYAKTLLDEKSYVGHQSFDMSEAEEQEVAAEEDADQEVASTADDSMEDASDDESDDSGGDDDSGDDDGGDDGGD